MRCLKCERPLEPLHPAAVEHPGKAGIFYGNFPYGSRHDQCIGHPCRGERAGRHPETLRRLWAADRIVLYVCDDCFERHAGLFGAAEDLTDAR